MYQTEHHKTLKDFFKQHQNEQYTSKMICDIFKDTIHPATIYRKLVLLEEENIIHRVYQPQNRTHAYQYFCKECSSHLHLICIHCGKMIHLKCEETSSFMTHILKDYQFRISQSESHIFGLCEECVNG